MIKNLNQSHQDLSGEEKRQSKRNVSHKIKNKDHLSRVNNNKLL